MAQRITTNDQVVVIAGKDKGKRGRVLRLTKDRQRAVVEGINMSVRHRKANPQEPARGGRTEVEAPIHISNLMPWSDKDAKGVRVRFETDGQNKVRLSAASGEQIVAGAAPAEKADKSKKADDSDEEKGDD